MGYAMGQQQEIMDMVQGRAFSWAWEFGESQSGPAFDLTPYQSAEFRLAQGNAPSLVWTLAGGQITKVNNQFVLALTAAETLAAVVSNGSTWRWMLSVGVGASADEPFVQGALRVWPIP